MGREFSSAERRDRGRRGDRMNLGARETKIQIETVGGGGGLSARRKLQYND
jgi:hypothetical protein